MPPWQTAICRLYHGHPARGGEAQGTACFITRDRLLTAAHLVRNIAPQEIHLRGLPRDAVERAVQVQCHPTLDLAVLQIGAPQPIRPLRIAAEPLPEGAELTLCGFPDPDSGLRTTRHRLIARDGTYQLGIVQGYPGKGFSGGPALLGAAADTPVGRFLPPRAIGICAARHTDRNEGLIVPLAAAPELLAEVTQGKPDRQRRRTAAALALAAAAGLGWWLLQPDADPAPDTAPLSGSIRNGEGEPIVGATITATEHDRSATTDHLGRFRLQIPAPAGTLLELVVNAPGHRGWRDYAAAGTTGLGIQLQRRQP